MADMWAHEFCLGCDKQTDGTAYCSESCRLADFEKTSTSAASSPGFNTSTGPWTSSQRQSSRFYLPPAIDFSNAQSYGSLSSANTDLPTGSSPNTARPLTASSSNTSLASMGSNASSNTDSYLQLNEKTQKELCGYAASFDSIRTQRRRSY
ncbi:hypothetical protein BN1723_007061, partial [Verticillium longisporum]